MSEIKTREFDVIVVGGGGLVRTAQTLSQSGLRVAVVSKVFPLRSHTVSAQGGINAALGNYGDDQWQWHMYDTVVGSDFLGDQDAIELMRKEAPECIIELEHMGLPFSRNEDGTIYQRSLADKRSITAKRLRTELVVLRIVLGTHFYTLYQQNVAVATNFLNEWFAVDLVVDDQKNVAGVSAIEMATGEKVFLKATATVLATGGAGQIFQSNTNAHICTGDGMAMTFRQDIGLQDMEMWQFHPTGLLGTGILISEGTRGEAVFCSIVKAIASCVTTHHISKTSPVEMW